MRRILAPSLILFCLSACAVKGPKLKDIEGNIPPIPAGGGRIFFLKPDFRAARIAIDEKVIGTIEYGAFFWEDLPAGNYDIRVDDEMDFGAWKESVTLAPGAELYLRVKARKGQKIAAALFGPLGSVAEAAVAETGKSGAFQVDKLDSVMGRKELGELAYHREEGPEQTVKAHNSNGPSQPDLAPIANSASQPRGGVKSERAAGVCSPDQILSMKKSGLSDAQVQAACR